MTAVSNRLPSQIGAQPFVVELDRFRGPLDLLLHLIRSQDIDIFDIPISQITHQFHEILADGIDRIELDRAGEFLELAATLVRIKAQMLLPRPEDAEWDEDPRAELVRRLLEYELFQEVARVLNDAESERRRHFPKGYLPPRPQPEAVKTELSTTWEEFLEVAFDVPDPDPITTHVAPVRVVTVEEKITVIERLLGKQDRVLFSRLFGSWFDRGHVVASLLACLEMGKQQLVRLEQVKRFGSIWLFRGNAMDGGPETENTQIEDTQTEAEATDVAEPTVSESDEASAPESQVSKDLATVES